MPSIIKIPSKHIYEIDNQKVIDNQVGIIEAQEKVPQLISDTQNVYNDIVYGNGDSGTKQTNTEWADTLRTDNMGKGKTNIAISYIEMTPRYITKTFNLPTYINDAKIMRIFTGKDENGQPNIRYNLRGDIKKGVATGESVINIKTADIQSVNINSINSLPPTTQDLDTPYELGTDVTTNVKNTVDNHMGGSSVWVSAVSQLTLQNASNIFTAKVDTTNNTITLIILCGLKTIKLGGIDWAIYNGTTNLSLSGTYEEYISTQVNISFYGDTITLDLQDNTISLGDGKTVYSFSGNELIQSTNYIKNYPINLEYLTYGAIDIYSFMLNNNAVEINVGDILNYNGQPLTVCAVENNIIEFQGYVSEWVDLVRGQVLTFTIPKMDSAIEQGYKEIIRDWNKGKEVATIKCGIEDYYDTDGNLVISNSKKNDIEYADPVEIEIDKPISSNPTTYFINVINGTVAYNNILYYNGEEVTVKYALGYNKYTINLKDKPEFQKMIGKGEFTVYKSENIIATYNMVFHIDDIVIPYVRGANGKDKPMSKYPNGEPKQFSVVSTDIAYDGAVWQTLELLETKNNE